MSFVFTSASERIATIEIARGKVNAIDNVLLEELDHAIRSLHDDPETDAVIIKGHGAFFSFGFDIPALYNLSPEAFTQFLTRFAAMIRNLFVFPKPVIAAINGHAIAGGCILATACDRRVMVGGKARISLNELTFGASVFQSAVELMRFWVGSGRAQDLLYSGQMLTADEAMALGLVDAVVAPPDLTQVARQEAAGLGKLHGPSFGEIKLMLRKPIIDRIMAREEQTIAKFVEIWYSEPVRANLQHISIRD